MTAVEPQVDLSPPALEKLRSGLIEQVRLLKVRLSKSAIPEDGWEFTPALADAQLKLALIDEIRRLREPVPAVPPEPLP